MTDFIDAVRRTLEGIDHFSVGPCGDCPECRRLTGYGDDQAAEFKRDFDAGHICDEGSFGKYPCESCGSTLAGNRYDAHGLIDGELCHFSVCVDCLFYHSNGDLPEDTA